MVRQKLSESEPEASPERSSSEESESESEAAAICQRNEEGVSEYEKQRLSRIADNKAIMEALGLRNMASSLMGSAQNLTKKKGKAKVIEDDEDYKPDDEVARFSSEREEEDEEEDNLGRRSSRSNKSKVKNEASYRKKRDPSGKISSNSEYMDNDDAALLRAIALSLQPSTEVSKVAHCGHSEASDLANDNDNVKEKRGKVQTQEETGRKKRKKPFASRLQMTEDELLLQFYQFDEEWKGDISTKDIRRVATAHDFTWTDKELADMILCFDSDGDGKLSLDDFRMIAIHCKMIEGSKSF